MKVSELEGAKLHNGRPLAPRTADEVKEAETIQGKRRRLRDYEYDNPLVRSVANAAYAQGLSGEDAMTLLAYEALLRLERLEQILLEQAMMNPRSMVVGTLSNI